MDKSSNKFKLAIRIIIAITALVLVAEGAIGLYYYNYVANGAVSLKAEREEIESLLKEYSLEGIAQFESLLSDCSRVVDEKDKDSYEGMMSRLTEARTEIEEIHSVMVKAEEKQAEFSGALNNFIVSNEQTTEYESLLKKLENAVNKQNSSKVADLLGQIDDHIESIRDMNQNLTQNTVESLKSANMDSAFNNEKTIIQNLQTEVEQLLSEEKYKEAEQKIMQWQAITNAVKGQSNYVMDVQQVDVTNFPEVKLYVRVEDETTKESVPNLQPQYFYLSEQVAGTDSFEEKTIIKAVQLDQVENLNINMVADVSGSMEGSPLVAAKNIMINFLQNIQFNIGDKASLVSFADEVYTDVVFTSDGAALASAVNRMSSGSSTALYDAIYVAINQTAMQNGAKCVIAFTDGMDNASKCTPDIITELASRYKIPVFIIGVGSNIDTSSLIAIANQTNGFYRNINDISSMAEIYNAIYRQQKELYLVEYQTRNESPETAERAVTVNYIGDGIVAREAYDYIPAIYMEATTSAAQLFVNDFVVYDSDNRYLLPSDLQRLTAEQLRLARNEIYARRGRRFKDAELQKYFNSKSWYQGTVAVENFHDSIFNDYERANAYFIQDYERLKGYIK